MARWSANGPPGAHGARSPHRDRLLRRPRLPPHLPAAAAEPLRRGGVGGHRRAPVRRRPGRVAGQRDRGGPRRRAAVRHVRGGSADGLRAPALRRHPAHPPAPPEAGHQSGPLGGGRGRELAALLPSRRSRGAGRRRSRPTGLVRVLEVAARQGDAHGDDAWALEVLDRGLARHPDAAPKSRPGRCCTGSSCWCGSAGAPRPRPSWAGSGRASTPRTPPPWPRSWTTRTRCWVRDGPAPSPTRHERGSGPGSATVGWCCASTS